MERALGTVLLCLLIGTAASAPSPNLSDNFLAQAQRQAQWLVEVRRHLHQIPEILYDLPKTSGAVERYLTELGIPFTYVGMCVEDGRVLLFVNWLLSRSQSSQRAAFTNWE